MGVVTEVSTSMMTKIAGELEGLVNKYNTEVSAIYDCGSELDGMWDGDTSGTFMTQLQKDRPSFDKLKEMLTNYVIGLREAAAIYDKMEAEAMDRVTSNQKRQ